MTPPRWRAALIPLRAVTSPDASLRDAAGASAPVMAGSLLLLAALLGSLALPRLLDLIAERFAGGSATLLDAHLAALRGGLVRYVLADRLLPPVPYVLAALIASLVAAPVLAGHGVRARAVAAVLVAGAAPLLLQRLGELAVVWLTPPERLAAGDVAGLAARFNIGVAGVLGAAGAPLSKWASVAAEAANGIGLWVVVLWGRGLARLDGGPHAPSSGAGGTFGWCLLAGASYGVGYALYAALLPTLLVLVMGAA